MDLSCKKCLIRDMADADMTRRIENTIAAIPPEQRCEADSFQQRLASCRQCERLLSGICRLCGCFVEVRASYEGRHCPDIPARW